MHESYSNPLAKRYSSKEIQHIFSEDAKFITWRKLWIALAESEQALGLNITDDQILELKKHQNDINYSVAENREREVRHDVMSHVYAYGEQAKSAKGIIHLGATSCYVGDNADIIIMKQAITHTKKMLVTLIKKLRDFAAEYKNMPTLAFTHFQSAQPTTVGKRATLWLNDLLLDLDTLNFVSNSLKLLGCKGTTGTGASFLALFDGDENKVFELEDMIASKMGFENCYDVSGQTYSRKVDYSVLSLLSSIAQSAHKFACDFRLLSHLKEFDEPFEDKQIGSSAMAYKRNPMRSERICSLARYVITDAQNAALTASQQWFERTLDDSANKRISIPEGFMAIDAILSLYINVIGGCRVYENVINKHLNEELPFMATENIMMYCVKKGGDRQELHEAIREHSVATGVDIKQNGSDNNLLDRIIVDPRFNITEDEVADLVDAKKFVGIAPLQVDRFLTKVDKIIADNKDFLGAEVEIRV
ncbi:MAG: adenylosuccinate lyase [Clostridiales bacterium]|jgi:adenylosuccinate lyase|nr:adenylosuccinate lyase [Clostridiales bacterium]